jgi:hypothetical protein
MTCFMCKGTVSDETARRLEQIIHSVTGPVSAEITKVYF